MLLRFQWSLALDLIDSLLFFLIILQDQLEVGTETVYALAARALQAACGDFVE